jgi:hypothetical protein
MFLFSVSSHMDGISKGHPNRSGWVDFTEILKPAAHAPHIRLQSNGHNNTRIENDIRRNADPFPLSLYLL